MQLAYALRRTLTVDQLLLTVIAPSGSLGERIRETIGPRIEYLDE